MNIKKFVINHRQGGNNYILKADSNNRWHGYSKSQIDLLREKFDDDFNIVIWGTKPVSHYYQIPFARLKHLFNESSMTTGKLADGGSERWTAVIEGHLLRVLNTELPLNIQQFYVDTSSGLAETLLKNAQDLGQKDEFFLQDLIAFTSTRIGQSKFRKKILNNYDGKCCISGIDEECLLVASHIVPWSHDKSLRGDPSNGLLLFVEYDKYFDLGLITLCQDMTVQVTDRIGELSQKLAERLMSIDGKQIAAPHSAPPRKEHISYHNQNIFNLF